MVLINAEDIQAAISEAYPGERRYALAAMQDIQRQYNYIPREALPALSRHFDCTVAQLYAMATFYKAFSLIPRGKHIIKLCDGTACHIRGAVNLINGIERLLHISPGQTTEDGLFTLELVNCLGSCALAPVMVVDDTYYGKVSLETLPDILNSYKEAAL